MDTKIRELFRKVCERETAEDAQYIIDFLKTRFDSFPEYFNAVYKDVMSLESDTMLRNAGYIDQEQFAFRRESADQMRRVKHDVAIDACAQINRQCDNYGIAHICPDFDGKAVDRTEIADFIGTFVYNMYEQGIGAATIDKAIDIAKDEHLDPNRGFGSLEERMTRAVKEAERSRGTNSGENSVEEERDL